MTIVSIEHGFAFVANPKCASTSIGAALAPFQERSDLAELSELELYTPRHAPAVVLQRALEPSLWQTLYTFAVVRNPFEWVVSQYAYNSTRHSRPLDPTTRLGTREIEECYDMLRPYRGQQCADSGTQWAFVCDCQRRVQVARLIRLDDLEAIWPALCARLHIDGARLRRLNQSNHPPAEEWLSGAARRRIEDLYSDDFHLYESALDNVA